MERLLVAMCRYINCLTSLTLALFEERHEGHKRSIAAFLSFFLSGFFSSKPPHLQRDKAIEREGRGWNRIKMKLEKLGDDGQRKWEKWAARNMVSSKMKQTKT